MKTQGFEIRDYSDFRKNHKEIVIHNTYAPDHRASLACELGRNLAIVAAQPDGEDSAGRQKCRLLTPDEVATRALDIAEAMWNGFEKRGWLMQLPDLATLNPPEDKAKELPE